MGNSASFPRAYSDVIGRAVTHEGPGWNRNTLLLLLRKFLFILHQTPYLFFYFRHTVHSFVIFFAANSIVKSCSITW